MHYKMIFSFTKKLMWPCLVACLFILPTTSKADEETLKAARKLAAKYANYTYGIGSNKIDCVHFVLEVAQERLQQTFSAEARKAILIAQGWTEAETQQKAKDGTDPKLGGVQYALTSVLTSGKNVRPADAKPGDLIQYWMIDSQGKWFGHSGIISKLDGKKATILGSHKSLNRVTELDKPLNLEGPNRHIFIVRIGE